MSNELTTVTKVESVIRHVLESVHGVKPNEIEPTSMIATELGLDGDDAVEFLEQLEEIFSVKLVDIQDERFWPEAGFFRSRDVNPISVRGLAEEIVRRQVP